MAENPDRQSSDLDALDKRIGAAQKRHAPEGPARPQSALGAAFRLSTDLVAAVVVGGGIGLALDAWLKTGPIFLLIFFFLGVGAGFFNVLRTARQMSEEQNKGRDE